MKPNDEMPLFRYGIETEKSDIRAHVGVANRAIYVFPTANALRRVSSHHYQEVTAGQPGVEGITARGWRVPWEDIPDIRKVSLFSWDDWDRFSPELSTSKKGELAVGVVLKCLEQGRLPLWISASETSNFSLQISGTDIVLGDIKIQVKCDWRAGERPRGTGNLFIQHSERNPLKQF